MKRTCLRPFVIALLYVITSACSSDAVSEEPVEEQQEEMEEAVDETEDTTVDNTPDALTYLERNGIVSVEFETVAGEIEWERGNQLSGFDGEGYLVWNQADSFQTPGNGILTYKLNIATPGTYQFVWRSRITEGDTQSEANDSWLRFNDAADFFGQRENSIVYPRGSGKTPNPEGSSADGWFKIYMNRVGEWFWRSNTSDNNPHDIFVTFESSGIYTMEVSGRSQFHGLDRFVLFTGSATLTDAQNAERSEIVQP
ncbi:hypothetical protein GCM10011414_20750 [Croceivirga lutea]|nr:hypothetical protein GCM10011414_20750 [Croceivirga lutea]